MEAVHSKYKHNQKKKNKKSKVTLDHGTPEKEKLLGEVADVADSLNDFQITIEEGACCSRSECVDNVESEISEAFKDVSDAKSSEEDSVGHSSCKEAVPDVGWVESPDCEESLGEDDIQRCLQDNRKKEKKRYTVETELDEMQALSLLQNQDDEEEAQAVTNFETCDNSTEVDVHVSAVVEHQIEPGCEALHIPNVVYEVVNEQPSAPAMETVHSVNVRHRKEIREKTETRNRSDETHLTLLQNLFWACQKEDEGRTNVRPFTEAQLLSLYRNEELKCMQNCVSEFLNNELRGDTVLCSRLYDMLVKYLRARGKLTVNNSELEILKSECKEYQHQAWSFQSVTVTESGECQDGNPVSAAHEYKMSKYNTAAASKLSHGLSAIKELVNESFSLNAYTCEALKLQIDSYVQTIVLDFAFLPQNARVSIGDDSLPAYGSHTGQDLRQVIAELRTAISVLFAFQRRRIKDEGFVTHTRQWLTKLVAVFLRVATWRDHVYLLHHILRCPAGVGKWAASLIQPPPPPFNCNYSAMHLDHMVATAAVLLKPVAERDQFLAQWNDSTIIEGESLWVIVDSDGDDEHEDLATNDVSTRNSLRESDVVDMFNQIPFDEIFRHVLGVRQRDNVDVHETSTLDESQVLRLFAFSTTLVNILETGLTTYKGSRYKQFSKRLGRLVRHTIQYATDQFQTFWVVCVEGRREHERDMAMLERLQVEYDELLFRAVRCLHNSPGRVAWQFLAVLPFSHASLKTLWQLFFFVLQYDVKQQDDGRSEPQESLFIWLTELIDAEIYYLLTTVSNMALARSKNDWSFIETATIHLLQIGFLNDTTRDVCSKSARIMLTNLTNKHPMLMSVIIDKLKKSSCGPVSNLASSMVRSQSNEQAFNVWLWQTMLCLHLHLLDQSEAFVWTVMANPVQAFSSLPELESQSEEMELLRGLVKQQESLASLAALLMTTVGHSLPIICAEGFTLLEQLQACYRHTAVIFCLQHIVPLFLDYPQSLITNEKFRSLMINLLSADRTYLKMARNLIAQEFPGMVLKQFGDMIQFHLENHHRYSLSSCAPLAQLWLQALCSVWADEPTSVVYLMDIVLAVAFFRSELKIACSGILSQLLQSVSQSRNGGQSGRLSSLLNWGVDWRQSCASLCPSGRVCPHTRPGSPTLRSRWKIQHADYQRTVADCP
ncbi:hypothetical protein LSTR_LSTR005390 [Laodelphax striatellus]|uniref:Ectopic P granules protein 5 homolog n=1 Tax=Laodelphax striatellus TaxID=195883 RepID=A0A482WQX0_LAOST|nr:hypothetical protein LSTR_LSTR005390 [Laodelphax striatellus]